MARKPCAQDVAQLVIDCKNECLNNRNPRIARNAILPFYVGPNGKKVFYIKNPAYFSGVAANNPGSLVTQAMQYSLKANRVLTSNKRTTVLLPPPRRALPALFNRLP
jgi:hypothetical protein